MFFVLHASAMHVTFKLLAFTAVVIAAASVLTTHPSPVFIYNPSPSVPTGLYQRANGPPRMGDFAIIRAARAAPRYARERHFIDRTDRFIKRISASSGQIVCAYEDRVSIDGVRVVHRLSHDTIGRALPSWSGCRRLAADEVLLLGDTPDSFDGRYWGPTRLQDIDGPWRPVQP